MIHKCDQFHNKVWKSRLCCGTKGLVWCQNFLGIHRTVQWSEEGVGSDRREGKRESRREVPVALKSRNTKVDFYSQITVTRWFPVINFVSKDTVGGNSIWWFQFSLRVSLLWVVVATVNGLVPSVTFIDTFISKRGLRYIPQAQTGLPFGMLARELPGSVQISSSKSSWWTETFWISLDYPCQFAFSYPGKPHDRYILVLSSASPKEFLNAAGPTVRYQCYEHATCDCSAIIAPAFIYSSKE